MLSRALLLAQATTALAGVAGLLALGHSPHPTAPVHLAARPVTAGLVSGTSAVQPVRQALVRRAVSTALPVRRAAPKASPASRRTTAPAPVRRVAAPPAVTGHTSPALTTQQRMDQAVGRIPGYRVGAASWVLSTQYGSWGTADWYHDRVYVSPGVPAARMYDVVSHEWSHLLSVRDYAGNVDAATAAMNRWFGGTDLVGAERAADCMAKQLGAVWTHYTSCSDTHWQDGARLLLSGNPLPS